MKLDDIKNIGVAGGGSMGFGIAINFALWGYPTVVYDLNDEILEKSAQRVKKGLDIFVTEGLISRKRADETFNRFTFTPDITKLANNDYITEVIVERLSDKQELFHTLDNLCPPQTIIASNTSGFVMSDIGKGVKRQDKIVLTHYFSPPHFVPGVEVAKGPGTTDETFTLTYDLLKHVKKVPVKVLKELPGYLLNTIQGTLGAAAIRLWAEGVASAEDIDLGVRTSFGFRHPHEGPMMHADLAGGWKWPKDILAMRAQRAAQMPGLSEEARDKLRTRLTEGRTWFVDPNKIDEIIEIRDREAIRRLKELYWGKAD
jgi:3-hydroxybutyryl-CoA dehydrogenase